jgi:hypothetical protein
VHWIGGDGRKIIVHQSSTLAAHRLVSGEAELVGHETGAAGLAPPFAECRIIEGGTYAAAATTVEVHGRIAGLARRPHCTFGMRVPSPTRPRVARPRDQTDCETLVTKEGVSRRRLLRPREPHRRAIGTANGGCRHGRHELESDRFSMAFLALGRHSASCQPLRL